MALRATIVRLAWAPILAIGLGCWIFAPVVEAKTAPALLSVQFAPDAGLTKVLIAMAGPVAFRAEIGVAPNQLAVTLDAASIAMGATAGRGFGPVRTFHAEAARAGQTRYVFDLGQPVTIAGTDLEPARRGKPAYAVITLTPADAMTMTASAGLVHAPDTQAESDASLQTVPKGGGPASRAKILAAANVPGPKTDPSPARIAGPVPVAFANPKLPVLSQALARIPATPRLEPVPARPSAKHTIVIDPGHGGNDPGAESVAGYHEKEITLATARALKHALEETGRYRVVLTRDRDIYLKLHERVRRARAAHGDLFVSLHADSVDGASAPRGASIYTLSETATDAESERLAQQENRADAIGGVNLKDESDDVAGILVDLTVRETVNDGSRFAGILVNTLGQEGIALFPRMPHRSAGFAVLKAPDIPSVLIEMGYLSNIGEARGLGDPQYQRRIARAVADGVDRYFAAQDSTRF